MLKVKCMYTKQLAKKRKTWSDGYLKINLGTRRCLLIDEGDYRGIGLASRALEPIEMAKLGNKEEFTMELAGVMVQIESAGYSANSLTSATAPVKEYQPPLKLAKFVPPSTVIPKPKPQMSSLQDREYPSSSSSSNQYRVSSSKSYRVSNDELDDIWGGSSSAPSSDRSAPTEPLHSAPPLINRAHQQPRRPAPTEVDYESKYRPTPRPTIINGSSSDELQRIIDSQWMKNSSDLANEAAESVQDEVWQPDLTIKDSENSTGHQNRPKSVNSVVSSGSAGVLPNGMTDFWGVGEASEGGAGVGVFEPVVASESRFEEGTDSHSVHYDIGYATAALSDTAVVDESIWSYD